MITLEEHKRWEDYLLQGGSLNQGSYLYVHNVLPSVRKSILEQEYDLIRSCDALPPLQGHKIFDSYCAAFTILAKVSQIRDINSQPVLWRSNAWLARESAILTSDPIVEILNRSEY